MDDVRSYCVSCSDIMGDDSAVAMHPASELAVLNLANVFQMYL